MEKEKETAIYPQVRQQDQFFSFSQEREREENTSFHLHDLLMFFFDSLELPFKL